VKLKSQVSFENVRQFGRQLAHVEDSTMFGKPALKVKGKMFVCMASHSSAEPDSLVARVSFEQRAELLDADPQVYYLTDHYKDYTGVLIRLARVREDVLQGLVSMAYTFVVRQAARKAR
jgi:hypothetical protein